MPSVPPSGSAASTAPSPAAALAGESWARLGYLLKVTQTHFTEYVREGLAPLGIDNREWAALVSLDLEAPLSQADVAKRAGIDRTTMVGLIDGLEQAGYVARRPDPADRRKNLVALTPAGLGLRERAAAIVDACEERFLTALAPEDGRALKTALQRLIESR